MKKLILLWGLLLAFKFNYAQTGANCSNAISISSGSCKYNTSQSGGYMWFVFTADDTTKDIVVTKRPTSAGHIHAIGLVSGNCSAYSVLDSAVVTASNDTLLTLHATGLVVGNSYYIVTERDNATCPKCIIGEAVFDICLSKDQLGIRPCLFMNGEAACCIPHACIDNSTAYCDLTTCVGSSNDFCFYYMELGPLYPTNYLTSYFVGSDIGTQSTGSSYSGTGILCYNPTWNVAGDYSLDFYYYAPTNDCGNLYHWVVQVHVLSSPLASFTPTSPMPFCLGSNVCFASTSSGGDLNYSWVINGSNACSSCTNTVCSTLESLGTTSVTLTTSNFCGSSSVSQDFFTSNSVSNFSYSSTTCLTSFYDLSSCQNSIVSWFWNFGDGTTSTDENPTHVYAVSGNYNVTLTIADLSGTTSSVTLIVSFVSLPPPLLSGPTTACVLTGNTYSITNYNPSFAYSISALPFPGSGIVGPIDPSGNFDVT